MAYIFIFTCNIYNSHIKILTCWHFHIYEIFHIWNTYEIFHIWNYLSHMWKTLSHMNWRKIICEIIHVTYEIWHFICEFLFHIWNPSFHIWNPSFHVWNYLFHMWKMLSHMNWRKIICEIIQVTYEIWHFICEFLFHKLNPSFHIWNSNFICEMTYEIFVRDPNQLSLLSLFLKTPTSLKVGNVSRERWKSAMWLLPSLGRTSRPETIHFPTIRYVSPYSCHDTIHISIQLSRYDTRYDT